MYICELVTGKYQWRRRSVRTFVTTMVGVLAVVAFTPRVLAVPPTATDFDLNPLPVNTVLVVTAADLVGSFATDPDGPLDATALDFDGATIGGVPAAGPADAGFSYTPGAGTAAEFAIDPTVAAFAGLTPGDSLAVEISYTVTDPDLDSDTGVLRYTVTGDPGLYDGLTFDHQGLPAAGVTAAAVANPGEAQAAVAITGPGTVESALAGYDFAAIVTPPAAAGAEVAVAIAIDDSTANASAEDASAATASATSGSSADATASTDSSAVASADNAGTATASADDASVASADADNNSIANAVSVDGSAANAAASSTSDALAFADDGSAAEASADTIASTSATAEGQSNATATASDGSTATAQATNTSSATAFADASSASSAEAEDGSIANSIAIDDSASSADAAQGSDALASTEDTSAAEATAGNASTADASAESGSVATASAQESSTADAIASASSSVTASAENGSVATSTADANSTSSAEADSGRTATSDATGGASIAVVAPAPVAFPEIDDDAPSGNALRLPERVSASADTDTPLPFAIAGTGGAIDRVVLDGFPMGTLLSAGTEESPGVWAFAGPPPPGLTFLLPVGSAASFLLDISINLAGNLGSAQAPMLVTRVDVAVPALNTYALILLALVLMLATAMIMRGRTWM